MPKRLTKKTGRRLALVKLPELLCRRPNEAATDGSLFDPKRLRHLDRSLLIVALAHAVNDSRQSHVVDYPWTLHSLVGRKLHFLIIPGLLSDPRTLTASLSTRN